LWSYAPPSFQYSLLIFAPEGVLCPIPVVHDIEFDYLWNGIIFDSNCVVEN
jgi:hypothetical protein